MVCASALSPGPDATWRPTVRRDALGSSAPEAWLSAYDVTPFYKPCGLELMDDPRAAKACALLLELAGAWIAGGAFGPRWRVVQFKQLDPATADVPPAQAGGRSACAFRNLEAYMKVDGHLP